MGWAVSTAQLKYRKIYSSYSIKLALFIKITYIQAMVP